MISKEEIEKFELETGIKLPDDYSTFLMRNPEDYLAMLFNKIHSDGYIQGDCILEFYEPAKLKEKLNHREYFLAFQSHFNLLSDYVETEQLILIAETLGGEIALAMDGKHRGKLYAIDNGDFGIIFLSNNIFDFLPTLITPSNISG
jgi:hypothetical protein